MPCACGFESHQADKKPTAWTQSMPQRCALENMADRSPWTNTTTVGFNLIGMYPLCLIHTRKGNWSHEGSTPSIPTNAEVAQLVEQRIKYFQFYMGINSNYFWLITRGSQVRVLPSALIFKIFLIL